MVWFQEFHLLCLNGDVLKCGVLVSEWFYVGDLPIYTILIYYLFNL